jgi:hypothetical protein
MGGGPDGATRLFPGNLSAGVKMQECDYLKNWTDDPRNPLLEPPFPEFLLGDPTVVPPQDSPDPNWHMFANTLLGIHHFTSADGIHWSRRGKVGPGFRPCVFGKNGNFYLFYEHFTVPQFRSVIALRISSDLWEWSNPRFVLGPGLSWEGNISRNTGNPCLVEVEGGYRLYYSAGVVFLPDLGFCEPLHIGVAHSRNIEGPYLKRESPVISPEPGDTYRNLGAGAIKVLFDEERGLYYGFNNGIYRDSCGRTRSAILLLSSEDGLGWRQEYPDPIISPEGDGWKRALVYQLDVKRVDGEMLMYYNARSGWRFGRERIGLATSPAV